MSAATDPATNGTQVGLRPLATTYTYYAAFVALGLISASLGPTLPALAEQTRTDLSQISFLFATRATGYLLGSLLGGRLYDRMQGHPVMAVALLSMGAGMVLAPVLPLLWILALVLLMIGVAEGTLDVGGNALLVWVHRSRVGPYMNALHFFFGLGAFLSPIVIAQAVLATGGIRWGYWLLALSVIPIVYWLLRLRSPLAVTSAEPVADANVNVGANAATENRRATNWRLTALLMLFMCVYVGAEVGMGGWLFTYAVEMGLANQTSAAYLTSTYWGAFMVGRLLSIPIAARFRPRVIMWTDLIGCMASVALIALWPEQSWAVWAGAFGFGLFVASVFPTMITWSERRMDMTGRVTSMFLVGASVGSITFPWLIGQLFDRIGPWITMPAILVCVILLAGVFVVVMAYGGPPRTGNDELHEISST